MGLNLSVTPMILSLFYISSRTVRMRPKEAISERVSKFLQPA